MMPIGCLLNDHISKHIFLYESSGYLVIYMQMAGVTVLCLPIPQKYIVLKITIPPTITVITFHS
jgi:hypothetical protein